MGAEVRIAGMQAVVARHGHERRDPGTLVQQSTEVREIARFWERKRARVDRLRVYSEHMQRRRPNMQSGTVGMSLNP